MRDDFQAERDTARRIADRQGIWSSFLMYMLFSATDILLVPDVAAYTIAARFAVGLVMLPIFEVQFRKGAPADRLDAICATGFIVAYVAWLIPAITTEMHQNFSYYMIFGAIFMVGANLFFSFRFSLSLAASSIVLLVFFVALYRLPGIERLSACLRHLLPLLLRLHLLHQLEPEQGAAQRLPERAGSQDPAERSR